MINQSASSTSVLVCVFIPETANANIGGFSFNQLVFLLKVGSLKNALCHQRLIQIYSDWCRLEIKYMEAL